MVNLWLLQKAQRGDGFVADITQYASNWKRTTRAVGGYWLGDFIIGVGSMSPRKMENFYRSFLGCQVIEKTFSLTSWRGEIVQMDLTLDGTTYRQSMDAERWHNRVKVKYRYPTEEDIEQGNLAYNPVANSFQDDGQDFSDWESGSAPAVYEIIVTNSDDSTCRGYLGAAFTTTNANDSIYVYTDQAMTAAGWSSSPSGKTPSSYIVRHATSYGTAQETAWAEKTSSTSSWGKSEYIDVIGTSHATPAEALRDRRLISHAYPKSIPSGGFELGGEKKPDSLHVYCAGLVLGMNRVFQETSLPSDTITNQLTTIVGNAEFVTAGRIGVNAMAQIVVCQVPRGLWDIAEELILLGDASNNAWVGGVYDDKKLHYELARTTVSHYWQNRQLMDVNGHRVPPSLAKPNIVVQNNSSTIDTTPAGGDAIDNPKNVWIEAVEFSMPDKCRLIPRTG